GDLDAQDPLDEVDIVHPDSIVVRQECTDLDTDIAADALLEAVLHRLHPTAGHRAGRQVLDALDGAELGTLAAGEAEVHVHEGDLAGSLLLLGDLVGPGRVGNALLLQATFDDVYRGHRTPRASCIRPGAGERSCRRGSGGGRSVTAFWGSGCRSGCG